MTAVCTSVACGSHLDASLCTAYCTVKLVELLTVCPFRLAVTLAVAGPRHVVFGFLVQV
ncbi:MAG TPA: hypothetical protein VEL31_09935 [Ktedonobacteraceae bacterium]|nr:hypothetical protein [Ktedonobacteraceae bacterium]